MTTNDGESLNRKFSPQTFVTALFKVFLRCKCKEQNRIKCLLSFTPACRSKVRVNTSINRAVFPWSVKLNLAGLLKNVLKLHERLIEMRVL